MSWLRFTQRKNRENEIIEASPCDDITFPVSKQSHAFTNAGIGMRMRKWCDAAKLDHCTAHGLRKAAACIAAEKGATEKRLMALFGWFYPRMAARYTSKANQKKIAGDSMHMITRRGGAARLQRRFSTGTNHPLTFSKVEKSGWKRRICRTISSSGR